MQIFLFIYWLLIVIFPQMEKYTAMSALKIGLFLLFDFITFLVIKLAMFRKIKSIEHNWYGHKAQRLHKLHTSNGVVKFNFEKINADDLKVGDLILVKSNTTCPADILIIDSNQ